MDRELEALTDSPEFRRCHEQLQAPPFDPFDVLQVADTEIRQELNVYDSVWWCFTFEPRHVFLQLANWGRHRGEKSSMDRLWSFLQETPIDPDRPARYPMERRVIYQHSLLKDDELSGPFDEVAKLLRHRMDEFFGAGGDRQRIRRYFKCLAFHPREPRSLEEGETTD